MLKSKHVVPAIELLGIGSLTAASLAVGGPIGGTVLGAIGLNLSSNLLEGAKAQLKEKWLNSDNGALNHDIQQALVRAFVKAVHRLESEYSKTADAAQLPRNRQAIRRLCKSLGDAATEMFMKADDRAISRDDLHSFLGQEPNDAYNKLWDQIGRSELFEDSPDGFKTFLRNKLFDQAVAQFGEELKLDNKESNRAWRAFERLLLEETIAGVEDVKASQTALSDAVDAGFAEFRKLKGVAVVVGRIDRTTTRTNRTATRIEIQLADVASDVKTLMESPAPSEQTKLPQPIQELFDQAWSFRDQGEYGSAKKAFREAEKLSLEQSLPAAVAKSKYGQAVLLNEQREKPEETRALLVESLQEFVNAEHPGGASRVMHQLGILESQLRNFDAAGACLNHSLDLARKEEDREGIAYALHQLADIEFQLGNAQQAIRVFDQALDEFHRLYQDATLNAKQKESTTEGIAGCHHHKALVYESAGNVEQTESNYLRALEWERKADVPINVGRTLFLLARLNYRQSNFDVADKYLEEATQIFIDSDDPRWAGMCLDLKGRACFTIGRPDVAELCFKNAINLTRDPEDKAKYLNKLGRFHLEAGQLDAGRKYVAAARDLSQREELPHEFATAIRNLAKIADIENDEPTRNELLSQAIDVFQSVLQSETTVPRQANLLGEIGAFFEQMGKKAEALSFYQRTKRAYEELSDVGGIANALGCIARMEHELGNDDGEFEIYREMKRLVDGTPYYDLIAGSAINLGCREMQFGRFDAAKRFFDEAEMLCVKHHLPFLPNVQKNQKILARKIHVRRPPTISFEHLVRELHELLECFPETQSDLLSFWLSGRDDDLLANYRTMPGVKLMLCENDVDRFARVAEELDPYVDLSLQAVTTNFPGVGRKQVPFPKSKERFFENGPLDTCHRVTSETFRSETTGIEGIVVEAWILELPAQARDLILTRSADELFQAKLFFLPYEKHLAHDELTGDLSFSRHVGLVPTYMETLPRSDDVALITSRTLELPLLESDESPDIRRLVRRVKRSLSLLATLDTNRIDTTLADLLDHSEELLDRASFDRICTLEVSVFELSSKKNQVPYVALTLNNA